MSSFTRRFGLNRFGGAVGGSGADDGYKFSNVDRDVVDALFAHLEAHTHTNTPALPDPSGAPTAVVSATGGVLAPGLELHYVVTYLDQYGMETGRSASVIVNTPDVDTPPGLPTLVGGTGGDLVSGNYSYWLTTLSNGIESSPSAGSSITLQPGQSSVALSIAEAPGDVYNVYRQGPADGAGYKIAQIAAGGTGYTDTGIVAPSDVNFDPNQLLPTGVGGVSGTYSVTVSVPAADATEVNQLPGWRVYRSVGDDSFKNPALVHTVVETVNPDGGGLVTSYVDTGQPTLAGQPPYTSQTLASHPVAGGGGGGGGGYVQAPVLTDPTGTPWAMTCAADGALATVSGQLYGTLYNPGYGPCLIDTSGVYWQLSVDAEGELSTTSITPTANDPTFSLNGGPIFYSARGVGWQLGVDTDGALTTTAL